MNRPPKLLKCTLDIGSMVTTSSWNATVNTIIAQPHPAYTDTNTGRTSYDGRDVVNGDYITTTASGKCLQITSITNKTDTSFNCILVDDDELNRSIDLSGDGRILEGNGYIFEVFNNVPVLFPLPSGLEAGFSYTFAGQLLARFLSKSGVGSVPEGVLSEDDIGALIAGLTNGKVPIGQLPVGTNPATTVAAGGSYLTSISLGQSVAPVVDGKIPVEYIPSVQDVFEIYSTYNDLLNIALPSVDAYYIVETENAVYKWTGTVFVKISGGATSDAYSYVSVTDSNTTYNASVKNVISIIADNVTILLPASPENGDDVIILNSGSGTVIDPNGETIRNSLLNYNLPDTAYSTYLVYVNGWNFSESNQLVNIYTQQPGADQFGPADYWPAGTQQKMENTSIFDKEAYVETWESTRTQIVTVLSYQAPYTSTLIKGVTTSTEGWVSKNVEAQIEGDKITIVGATAGPTGYGTRLNGTWEITSILSATEFEFIINQAIPVATVLNTSIGNTTRTVREKLAEQVTIFEPDSDNFRSIWFPKTGIALERYVTFDGNLMPTVRYANNLVLTVCKMLNIDWRQYETFDELVEVNSNFTDILNRQSLLTTISSNSDFISEFINARSDLHVDTPIMTSNTAPAGNSVTASSYLGGTLAYYAFDSNLDTAWQSDDLVTNQWLRIAMPSNIQLFPYSFTIYTKTIDLSPRTVRLEYQIGGDWFTVGDYILSNDTIEDTFFVFKEGIVSNIWRFTFIDCYSGTRMAVNNIKMRGWNLDGL